MGTITHYDSDLDINFELPKFEVENEDDILIKYHDAAMWAIFNAIITMDELELDHCPVFSFDDNVFEINRDNISDVIKTCLNFLVTTEEYDALTRLSEVSININLD